MSHKGSGMVMTTIYNCGLGWDVRIHSWNQVPRKTAPAENVIIANDEIRAIIAHSQDIDF